MAGKRRVKIKKVLPRIGRKTCRSDFEFQTWKVMSGLIPKGGKLEYEADKVPYILEREYLIDFTFTRKDGTMVYIETKGYFDAEDRQKHLAVRKTNPDLDIRFIFYNDGKIHKMSQTRYSTWCEQHGFKYAIRNVPEEWFNE